MNGAKSTPDRARSQSGWHKVFGVLSALAMRRLTTLAMLFTLAGCAAAKDEYPSLQIRDVERAQGQFTPTPAAPLDVPPVPVAIPGTLAEQLATLGQQAQASHQAFLKQVPATSRLADAARGSAIGSDAWASAQVALASLDSARSNTAISLADLDTIQISRVTASENTAAVDAVRAQVLALVKQEDDTLAELRANLR